MVSCWNFLEALSKSPGWLSGVARRLMPVFDSMFVLGKGQSVLAEERTELALMDAHTVPCARRLAQWSCHVLLLLNDPGVVCCNPGPGREEEHKHFVALGYSDLIVGMRVINHGEGGTPRILPSSYAHQCQCQLNETAQPPLCLSCPGYMKSPATSSASRNLQVAYLNDAAWDRPDHEFYSNLLCSSTRDGMLIHSHTCAPLILGCASFCSSLDW